MNRADEYFEQLSSGIELKYSQGLDADIAHILPNGWIRQAMPDGYVLTGPQSDQGRDDFWRMVRFLTYKAFFALRRTDTGREQKFEIVTCTGAGIGFKLTFLLVEEQDLSEAP